MTAHLIDGIDILLWSHPTGMSAFAVPWTFDLEYDEKGNAAIDANRGTLSVEDYPRSVDRYRVLDARGRAAILKVALLRRDDYIGLLPDRGSTTSSGKTNRESTKRPSSGSSPRSFARGVALGT